MPDVIERERESECWPPNGRLHEQVHSHLVVDVLNFFLVVDELHRPLSEIETCQGTQLVYMYCMITERLKMCLSHHWIYMYLYRKVIWKLEEVGKHFQGRGY